MSKRSASSLPITDKILASFRPSKILSYHDGASVTCLDFDNTGQYLISSGVDKSIQLYDCHKGVRYKDVQSQKYGAHLAKFTHNDLNCLYASTPQVEGDDADHSIRYLSLTSKSYLRYFRGHKDQVTALEVNPVSDTFLTASADHTVKHWDLRTATCMGSLGMGQTSVIAFDPHGIVFAVGRGPTEQSGGVQGFISLYDVASFERGAFLTVSVAGVHGEKWTKLEFSNNGKYLLVGTDSSQHYLLDAILGKQVAKLVLTQEYHKGWLHFDYSSTGSVCFTPDGRFVIAGSPHGTLAIFDLSKLEGKDTKHLYPFKVLDGKQGVTKVIAFDPKLYTFASADDSVVLWAPTVGEYD
ncbi:CIC11C00000004806 [Sungouiella intermedia]|uniref:CIC11C00000004806 n=1 Tax=Sungouiella intermedia TaxID=45354 RepID=A0A1L0D8Y2_9ASCO|nr:CIC11C00000004806 [[Candida] intermedia]